jgi:glycosyltransferase involved in cell wall biosynthesis
VEIQGHIRVIEESFRNGSVNVDALHALYSEAIESCRVQWARDFFDKLKSRFPNEREIQKLHVALCIHQEDYWAAMDTIEKMVAICTPDEGLIDAALAVRRKIGPITIAASQRKRGTISLCMIVKNEVAGIGACLNGAKKIADEIIVVDTGSSDRTADVASIYGAQTFNFTWCDDFAAARNFSLEQAKGDWILILDADEIIASSDHGTLKEMIAKHHESPIGFFIETRNYINVANAIDWQANDGSYPQYETGLGWFPTRKTRLFQRMDAVRFCHPVHEQVDRALTAAGIPIVECPVPVHHYGYLNETKNQKKAQTYFQLGYTKLDQLGVDFQAVRELATQAGQLEYWGQAIELWNRLLKIQPNYATAYVNIAGAHWQLGHYEKALMFSKQAIELDPDQKEGQYNMAVSLLLLGRAEKAGAILKVLVERHSGYLAAQFMLAVCLTLIGKEHQSRIAFKALQNSQAGPALAMAAKDLAKRLDESGLVRYAKTLKNATRMLSECTFLS